MFEQKTTSFRIQSESRFNGQHSRFSWRNLKSIKNKICLFVINSADINQEVLCSKCILSHHTVATSRKRTRLWQVVCFCLYSLQSFLTFAKTLPKIFIEQKMLSEPHFCWRKKHQIDSISSWSGKIFVFLHNLSLIFNSARSFARVIIQIFYSVLAEKCC